MGGHGAVCPLGRRGQRDRHSNCARGERSSDKVAICGYHGWHDWYLAANLGDNESLAGHLLPGLEPKGVPQNLRGSVLPFHYNNFPELEALVRASRHRSDQDGGLAQLRTAGQFSAKGA